VSFFEPPEPAPEPVPPVSLPEWLGPPANLIGGHVALGLMAARSDDAVVWLESAAAYPAGVQLRIDVRWRAEVQSKVMRGASPQALRAGEELPAELFRAGVEFADGSKATWLGPGGGSVAVAARLDERPKGPLLRSGAGGGGDRRWSQDLWLWPLPKEGPLQFVCEWPALGIELTRAELDWAALRDAAQRCITLWEEPRL
jgi:hypothetical protein